MRIWLLKVSIIYPHVGYLGVIHVVVLRLRGA